MSARYGLDEYGRYEEIEGERLAIEPYPFTSWRKPWTWWIAARAYWHIFQWKRNIGR
jgi:hypothetical protein